MAIKKNPFLKGFKHYMKNAGVIKTKEGKYRAQDRGYGKVMSGSQLYRHYRRNYTERR